MSRSTAQFLRPRPVTLASPLREHAYALRRATLRSGQTLGGKGLLTGYVGTLAIENAHASVGMAPGPPEWSWHQAAEALRGQWSMLDGRGGQARGSPGGYHIDRLAPTAPGHLH